MKLKIMLSGLLLGGGLLYGQNTFEEDNGPNAPVPGDIVPDMMTFAMSQTRAVDLVNTAQADNSFRVPNLENRRYSDFPNEVVVTVYHTPW